MSRSSSFVEPSQERIPERPFRGRVECRASHPSPNASALLLNCLNNYKSRLFLRVLYYTTAADYIIPAQTPNPTVAAPTLQRYVVKEAWNPKCKPAISHTKALIFNPAITTKPFLITLPRRTLNDPRLWELWYHPNYGQCRIYIMSRSSSFVEPSQERIPERPFRGRVECRASHPSPNASALLLNCLNNYKSRLFLRVLYYTTAADYIIPAQTPNPTVAAPTLQRYAVKEAWNPKCKPAISHTKALIFNPAITTKPCLIRFWGLRPQKNPYKP